MEDDWDLQAVVRSYTATISTTATTSSTTTTSGSVNISSGGAYMTDLICSSLNPSMSILRLQKQVDEEKLPCLPVSPFVTRKNNSSVEELHDLYKPFFANSLSSPVSPPTIQRRSINPLHQRQQQLKQSLTTTSHSPNSSTRSKRRKNLMKKVLQVPAEGLASDTWSWRKYGQKPIKGSPYPRGYYKCSSSKGCLARKQVERNRTDPTIFIITYTAEHNHPVPTHRNSLAGTTRHQKQPSSPLSPSIAVESSNDHNPLTTTTKPSYDEIYSQNSVTKLETRPELDEGDEDGEDEENGFSDMAMSDDFFDGLDEIACPAVNADFFTDNVPASFVIPWMANNAAAAAGSS